MLDVLKWTNTSSAILTFVFGMAIIGGKFSEIFKMSKFYLSIFLIAASSSFWSTVLALSLWFNSPVLIRFSWFAGGLLVVSYFYSTIVLVKHPKSNLWTYVNLGIAIFFGIIGFTSLGVVKVVSVYPLHRIFGSLHLLFRLWLFICAVYSIYTSLMYYISLEGLYEKLKFRPHIYSSTLYAGTGTIFTSILPLVGYESGIYLVPICSIFWVVSLLYSTQKYKLLDVEVIICDVVKYVIYIGLILILNYFLYIFFVSFTQLAPLYSSIISIIIIGSLYFFSPLKEGVDAKVKDVMLKKRSIYQKLLKDTAKAVIEILDMSKLLNYVLEQIHLSLGANKLAIFLLEEGVKDNLDRPRYRLAASYGIDEIKSVYLENYKIINWLKEHKEPLLLDFMWYQMNRIEYKKFTEGLSMFDIMILVPITYKGQLIGILTLDQKKANGSVFDIEDIEILKSLSDQLAIAIQNSFLYKELDDAYLQIVRALSLTFESKVEYSIGHTDEVVKYAVMLAKKLNLPEKDIFVITQAAILHDLGKITLHDYIFTKPGTLTKEEWEEVKRHPIKGAEILEPLPFLKEVKDIVRNHHERYDGKGYPDGLKGEDIPLGARILAVCDAVDAMLSERPYRQTLTKKLTLEEVIQELKSNSGTQFDPVIVKKFLEIIEENKELFERKNGNN